MVGPSNPQKKSKQIQEMGSHYIFRCEFGTRRGRASTSFFLGVQTHTDPHVRYDWKTGL